MPSGGKRIGAGRKRGSLNAISAAARESAAKTGELPHELLLRIARGELIDGQVPSLAQRIDAAKAAAPYFAPRLAASSVTAHVTGERVSTRSLTDEQLIAIAAKALD